jgi:hypothetical protein
VIAVPRSETAAAEARAAQLPQEQMAKTVVLHTSAGYRFAVIAASDRLDLHTAAAASTFGDTTSVWSPRLTWRRTSLSMRSERSRRSALTRRWSSYEHRLLDCAHVLCPVRDHEHSLLIDPIDIVRVTGARSLDAREV